MPGGTTAASAAAAAAAVVVVVHPPAVAAATAATSEGAAGRRARLCVKHAVRAGDVLARLDDAPVLAAPRFTTVQVGVDMHLDLSSALVYMNHSCAPSVVLDTVARTVVAAHDLAPGDEVTFFYPSTEWRMAEPFPCWCGADQCLKTIAGAADVPVATLGRYYINPHIRALALACLQQQPLPGPSSNP